MAAPLIELKNVIKRFGKRTILDQVNITIHEGETTTIIGKSGVGKSITLKLIIGLLEPDEGEILFKGKPIKDMPRGERKDMKRRFSYMFQNNALFDSMTVFQNIALPLAEKTAMPRDEIERLVLSRIDRLELSEVTHQYQSQISGGMQKRVALARALITDPEIVLFDEPTTGLDPIRKNAVLGMIAHIRRQLGFTAVIVSHEIPDVFFISNRIAILYDGRITFQGTPSELNHLEHPVIDEFSDSLRSLKDELTGMETRGSFERQYQHEFGLVRSMEEFTAILFTIEILGEVEGQGRHRATETVLKALSPVIEKHMGGMGKSSRYASNEILSVLPHTDKERTGTFLGEISKELQAREILQEQYYPRGCLGIAIRAGITRTKPGTTLETLASQAKSSQTTLAEITCKR